MCLRLKNDAYINGISTRRNQHIQIQRSYILGLVKHGAPKDAVRIKVSHSLLPEQQFVQWATSNHEVDVINMTDRQMLKYTFVFASFALTRCKTKWILGVVQCSKFSSTWKIFFSKKKKRKGVEVVCRSKTCCFCFAMTVCSAIYFGSPTSNLSYVIIELASWIHQEKMVDRDWWDDKVLKKVGSW